MDAWADGIHTVPSWQAGLGPLSQTREAQTLCASVGVGNETWRVRMLLYHESTDAFQPN